MLNNNDIIDLMEEWNKAYGMYESKKASKGSTITPAFNDLTELLKVGLNMKEAQSFFELDDSRTIGLDE